MSTQSTIVAEGRAVIIPFVPAEAGKELERQMTEALKPLEAKLKQASANASKNIAEPLQDGKIENTLEKVGKNSATKFRLAFAAAIGIGAILFSEFQKVEAAFNQIRIATGATGSELRSFEDSARNVAKNTVASLSDVGFVIGDIVTRLGLSGRELDTFATNLVNLSVVTGESLQNISTSSARVLNNWNVAQGEYVTRLNEIFRATQESGIGVQRLNDLLSRNGALLRQLGFSLTEATALFATFEKEGLNTEQIMTSLSRALANFGKRGLSGREALEALFEQIKAAPSDINSMIDGIEIFGQRFGPQFVALIKEGKISIDEMFDAIQNGEDTINKSEEATRTLNESIANLKETIILTVEPVFRPLINSVNSLTHLFNTLPAIIQLIVLALAGATAAALKFDFSIKKVKASIAKMSPLAKTIGVVGIAFTALSFAADMLEKRVNKMTDKIREEFGKLATESEKLGKSLELERELGITAGIERFDDTFKKVVSDVVVSQKSLEGRFTESNDPIQNWLDEKVKSLTSFGAQFEAVELGTEQIKNSFKALTEIYKESPKEANRQYEKMISILQQANIDTALISEVSKQYKDDIALINEELEENIKNEEYKKALYREFNEVSLPRIEEKQEKYRAAIKRVEDAQKALNEEIVITISRLKEFDDLLSVSFNPLKGVVDAYQELENIFQRIDDIKFENMKLFQAKADLRTYDPQFWSKMRELEEQINANNKERLEIERSIVDVSLNIQRAEKGLIDALAEAQRQGIDPRVALEQILGSMQGIAPEWVIEELRGKMLPLLDRFQGEVEQVFQDEMIAEIDEKEKRLKELADAEAAKDQAHLEAIQIIDEEALRIIEKFPPETEAQMNILTNFLQDTFSSLTEELGINWEDWLGEMQGVAQTYLDDFKTRNTIEEEDAENLAEMLEEVIPQTQWWEDLIYHLFDWRNFGLFGMYARREGFGRDELNLVGQRIGEGFNWLRDKIGLRAEGGPVSRNSPYIVGERGPELFVPNQSGKIISNDDLMGYNKNITNVFQTRELSAAELAGEVEWRQGQQLKGRQR